MGNFTMSGSLLEERLVSIEQVPIFYEGPIFLLQTLIFPSANPFPDLFLKSSLIKATCHSLRMKPHHPTKYLYVLLVTRLIPVIPKAYRTGFRVTVILLSTNDINYLRG